MTFENQPTILELTQQLRKFGLTQYQASALAAVLVNKRISVVNVSKRADVPITKIYGILEELEVRGYVTQELGRPKHYTSPEPQIVMGLLVKMHERQLRQIKECSRQMLQMVAAPVIAQ